MGAGRTPLRHHRDLVPDRRRPLHGLHVHRRACADVRRRRDRLLRRAVHRDDLSDPVSGVPAPVVGGAQARLHHIGRFRARTVRQSLAGAGDRVHRHPGDHAVHRAAACRHPGGDRRDGRGDQRLRRRSAADHRVRHPGRVHLHLGTARAGDDRHREGRADLHHGDRRRHRRADPSRRLRQGVLRDTARQAAARRAAGRFAGQLQRLCHAGARLGLRAVPVSALDHRHPERIERAAWCGAMRRFCRPTR